MPDHRIAPLITGPLIMPFSTPPAGYGADFR
jgi:hypothetical protein